MSVGPPWAPRGGLHLPLIGVLLMLLIPFPSGASGECMRQHHTLAHTYVSKVFEWLGATTVVTGDSQKYYTAIAHPI